MITAVYNVVFPYTVSQLGDGNLCIVKKHGRTATLYGGGGSYPSREYPYSLLLTPLGNSRKNSYFA